MGKPLKRGGWSTVTCWGKSKTKQLTAFCEGALTEDLEKITHQLRMRGDEARRNVQVFQTPGVWS